MRCLELKILKYINQEIKMAYESNASKVKRYKVNILTFQNQVVGLKTDVRMMERKIVKLELRDNQIISLLKSILKYSTKSAMKENTGKLTIKNIIDWMDDIIIDYRTEEDKIVNIIDDLELASRKNEHTEFGIDPE